ncbi:hypothetical protein CHS0354_038092 [Potamilus streckersoni]|uniref:Uncharacterized protein n=1 Tax=Potamilus streckersoni TaxID=2493646 RepID=A0AAE0W0Q4_9BIVA|nr:hypothetical protein CHS0354_038092 [Potamilus streckersoni]
MQRPTYWSNCRIMESPLQIVPRTPQIYCGGHHDYIFRPSPLEAVVPELVLVQSENETEDQTEDYLVPHTPKSVVQSSDRQWKIPSLPAKRFYSSPFVNSPYMRKRRCSKDSDLQEQIVPVTPMTPLTPSASIKKQTDEINKSPYITTPKRQSILKQRKTTHFPRPPHDCHNLDLFDDSDIFG